MDDALNRQQILDAFGVTEDEVAAVQAETGWNAARVAAEQERSEFIARMRAHAAKVSADLGRKFGAEVRWDDAAPHSDHAATVPSETRRCPVCGSSRLVDWEDECGFCEGCGVYARDISPRPSHAARRPKRVGDRVVTPDGVHGYVALVHPTIPGAVFVQPDTPDMAVYMQYELEIKDDA